jgi:hypothetical protein
VGERCLFLYGVGISVHILEQQKKVIDNELTYVFLALTLALNLMSAFTSSTLLLLDASMSGG